MKDVLKGQLVRFSAVDSEQLAKAYGNWAHDAELMRLMDSHTVRMKSVKATQAEIDDELKEHKAHEHFFSIRALEDDRLLGDIGLFVINNWSSRDAFIGIGIGDRAYWGKGYGTDAMRTMLRYAFTEVNLRRVTLTVFEYNPRAIRSYEKAGFRHEGRHRGVLLRDGKRYDVLFMGCLWEEWKEVNQ